MRIALITLAALAMIPVTALADDSKPDPKDSQPAKATSYVTPESVPYEGGKIPADAVIDKRPNLTLVGTGLGIAGTVYVASVITSIAACPPQSTCSATSGVGWLYLPLVGPFVTAAMAGSPGGAALAAFDGGLQVLGGVLALAGVLAPKKFVVWQDKSASLAIKPTANATPALVGEAKPSMSAGISFTLTHL
jgi:hypothetical protein